MHCLRQLDDHREHYIIYSYSTHCLRQCHLLIAYHLSCNPPSISIWLAVFSPSASGRCTGGIFSQSGRTHNFHHICCLCLDCAQTRPNYNYNDSLPAPASADLTWPPRFLFLLLLIYQTFTCYMVSTVSDWLQKYDTVAMEIHLFYIAAVVINSEIDIIMFNRIVGQICCLD